MQPQKTTPGVAQRRGTAIASLVFGILSLVTLLSVFKLGLGAIIGLLPAIIAIILAAKAKKVRPTDGLATGGLITGIIGAVFSAVGFFIFIVISLLSSGSPLESLFAPDNSSRTAAEAQIAEQKDFALGETMHIGNVDLKVTKVTENYAPTAQDNISYLPTTMDQDILSGLYHDKSAEADQIRALYKDEQPLTSDNAEYVLVEGVVSPNGKTPATHTEGVNLLVNFYKHASIKGGGQAVNASTRDSNDVDRPFSAIFYVNKNSDKLTLNFASRVYPTTSLIVGTEGMGSDFLLYSLQLR